MFAALQKPLAVWALLTALTLLSYASWAEAALGDGRLFGSAVIVIAFAKARLIGLDYMELRHAYRPLRAAFEGWVLAMGLVLVGMFWVTG